jgi:CheY-like chemotaxis protein
MPGLDGFELIHRVRSWEKMLSPSSRRIRAAAVSAYAALGQRLRHARDEFQAFLSKPVDPQDLVRTVRDLYDQAD